MATKTIPTPEIKNAFETWTEYAQAYTDLMFETTQKAIDQTFALTARTTDLMVETAKKAQEWTAEEQTRAFDLAETLQGQVKAAAERTAKMAKDFSAN